MLPPLRRRFDRLERQRAELLAELARRTDAALRYQPSPEAWSTLQVIEHLVIAEESILALAARRAPKPVPFMERLGTGVRLRALYLALASNRRFRVPLPTLNPSGAEIGLEELQRRWTEARWQLARALEAVTRETASGCSMPFPSLPISSTAGGRMPVRWRWTSSWKTRAGAEEHKGGGTS